MFRRSRVLAIVTLSLTLGPMGCALKATRPDAPRDVRATPHRVANAPPQEQELESVGAPKARTLNFERDAAAAARDPLLVRFSPRRLAPGEMALHVIDVGQGDALLLEFSCAAALVDTGLDYSGGSGAKERLADYLDWFFGTRRPDLKNRVALAALSHSHADHANGVPIVLGDAPGRRALRVEHAIDSGYDTAAGADEQQRLRVSATEGTQSITAAEIEWLGGATSPIIDPLPACSAEEPDPSVRVLWGSWTEFESAPENPNHHSQVLRLDYGAASFLFTGDLQTGPSEGTGGLEVMLLDYQQDLSVFDVDVLKVSHHGAENGTTDALLAAVTPCLATIGVGNPERRGGGSAFDHGHPRAATITRLQDPTVGVSGRRPAIHIATFAAEESPPTLVRTEHAIFGSAWDGHTVVFASPQGEYIVETENMGARRLPVACP